MTKEELANLKVGDILRWDASENKFLDGFILEEVTTKEDYLDWALGREEYEDISDCVLFTRTIAEVDSKGDYKDMRYYHYASPLADVLRGYELDEKFVRRKNIEDEVDEWLK